MSKYFIYFNAPTGEVDDQGVFKHSGFVKCRKEIPTRLVIRDVAEGFWINNKNELTHVTGQLEIWIPPSQILFVTKEH